MKVPHFPSIISRVVFLHVIAIATIAVFMPVILFWLLDAETTNLHQHDMSDLAAQMARHLSANPDGSLSLDLSPALRAQYSSDYGRYSYAVLDNDGRTLFTSREQSPSIFAFERDAPELSFHDVQQGNSILSGAVLRKDFNGQTLWVQVGEDLAHRDVLTDDIVANFFRRVSWITIPILLLLLATDILIFRRAIRPLYQASSEAANITPSRTDIRLPVDNIPREILPLVKAVNQALDRLDRGFQTQREFTADAAHELRTPLAVLRARIDTLENEDAVATLRQDVEGMGRIVGQLLELSELDGLAIDAADPVDLRTVCAEVAEFVAPLAVTMNREVALKAPEQPVEIPGNAELLKRAVRNLVENALTHTKEHSTVEIRLDERGTITVCDDGPGIRESDREMIFERFWRADRTRSGGAGLGLSIVKQIVEAHGGRVSAANRPAGGAAFSIRFDVVPLSRKAGDPRRAVLAPPEVTADHGTERQPIAAHHT
jgi:signal transduction histidine kinase